MYMSERGDQQTARSADHDEGRTKPDRLLRSDGGVRPRNGLDGIQGAIAFGLAVFAVLALSLMATSLLSTLVLDSRFTLGSTLFTGGNTDHPLFWAAFSAYSRLFQSGILLAIVLGIYLAQSADTGGVGAIRGAAANGLGAGLTFVALSGLLVLTGGESSSPDVVELLEPAAATTVGTIVAGAGAGYATVALREN